MCESVVGERGLKLSGGEVQRVAIARAILKQPNIIVFDEATSSLDTNTEVAVMQAIREVTKHVTSLMIAHRLSTIIDADKIYVIESGRVVEQGNHAQLLANNGLYSQLWALQQKDVQQRERWFILILCYFLILNNKLILIYGRYFWAKSTW